ncbi:hypothetical protein [Thiolapillus sp.]
MTERTGYRVAFRDADGVVAMLIFVEDTVRCGTGQYAAFSILAMAGTTGIFVPFCKMLMPTC